MMKSLLNYSQIYLLTNMAQSCILGSRGIDTSVLTNGLQKKNGFTNETSLGKNDIHDLRLS